MQTIWKSTEEVIDYAIMAEQQAATNYTEMANVAKSRKTRKILLDLAEMESDHKLKLLAIKKSGAFSSMVLDLAAMDESMMPSAPPAQDMSPKQAIAFAIKAEKAAQCLYAMLASMANDRGIAQMFKKLALEEKSHAQALSGLHK